MAVGLTWKPNIFSARAALKSEGSISSAPLDTRKAALDAIDAWKKKHGGGEDSVFLVSPGANGGWEAQRFSENRATQADLSELKLEGTVHPQAFIVDSRGRTADPEDSAKFELIFSGNGVGDQKLAKELTNRYYDALHAQLGNDVRFHWGQVVPDAAQSPERLAAAYPRFAEFERVRSQLDPSAAC